MTTEASPAHRAVRSLGVLPAPLLGLRAARARWVPFGACVALGALLFWAFDALPFMDLPAHAGLIALRHRWATSAFDQRYFDYVPRLGPYALFRAMGELFARVWGPVGAVRALATLPVVTTPLALLFARKRLHGAVSPGFGYGALLLSFGLMTLFGFASYLLGEALLVVALTAWLELLAAVDDRAPRAALLELVVALGAPALFVAHAHAFVVLLALAPVACVAAGDRLRRLVRLRALLPGVAFASFALWDAHAHDPGSAAAGAITMTPLFHGALDKLSLVATPTLMTKSGVDVAAGLALWVWLVLALVLTARVAREDAPKDPRARHTRALLACTVALAALFLALPHAVGWFGFVDGRVVPLVLLVGLLAVREEALSPWLRFGLERLAPLLVVAVLVVDYAASAVFQGEARGWREILAEIPAEARVLNLPLDPNSDVFTGHPFVHYDKLLLVDRPAVLSDVWFNLGTAVYPRPTNPALRLPASYLSSDLHVRDLSAYPLGDWDYVLARTRPSAAALPLDLPPSLRLVDHRGGWWLLKEAPASP